MSSRGRSFSGLIGLLVVLVMLVGVLAVPALLGDRWRALNPFAEKTVDRTGPSVLKSLNDLSEYHAASGYYETVVDLEKDTAHLPDWISGERVIYVGKGDVDAVIDFGELDGRRVVLSQDGTSVTVRLPAPTVDEPVLDLETSYVVEHEEGLATKFQGSDLEEEAQLKAVEQMTAAATGEGMLIDLAETNTILMLRGLLGALGCTDITITFDEALG